MNLHQHQKQIHLVVNLKKRKKETSKIFVDRKMTIIHSGKRVSLILQTKESTSEKMLLDIEGLIGTTIGLMKILRALLI